MSEITKTIYDGLNEKITTREVFANTLNALFDQDRDVVYLDADLMNSFGTLQLSKDRPDRCINSGIMESNMMGVAGGMSAVGKKPYVHTFGPFASRRVFDQVFLSIGYADNSVRIIGTDPGITAAFNGGTHMPFEDVQLYRSIPEALIIDCTDSVMFEFFLKSTVNRPGVTYFRIPRKYCVGVYENGETFQEGKGKVLRDGSDVAIVASGIMVPEALAAAIALEKEGVSAAVIDVVTVKPIDQDLLVEYAKKCGAMVTVENSNELGSMGAAVCGAVAEKYPVPILSIGSGDRYGEVGPEDYLRKVFKLTPENIIDKAKDVIKLK